jgi:hypothetical protein
MINDYIEKDYLNIYRYWLLVAGCWLLVLFTAQVTGDLRVPYL